MFVIKKKLSHRIFITIKVIYLFRLKYKVYLKLNVILIHLIVSYLTWLVRWLIHMNMIIFINHFINLKNIKCSKKSTTKLQYTSRGQTQRIFFFPVCSRCVLQFFTVFLYACFIKRINIFNAYLLIFLIHVHLSNKGKFKQIRLIQVHENI